MKNRLNNLKRLEAFRKDLRNNGTSAEATLWNELKNKKLNGRKFRRQHSFGPFIMDFYCPSEKLAIELDGKYHFTEAQFAYDERRTQYLNKYGIKVVRFENKEAFEDMEGVLKGIREEFSEG